MIKKFSLISLLAIALTLMSHGQSRRVLFLGNSYTGVNNLPKMLSDLALSAGDTLIYDSNTPGGYTLQSHSTNATTLAKIAQANWDFVVLQEQSQRPSFPIAQVRQEVFPYARQLTNAIRLGNKCTQPIFYMTWGRENGDASNCQFWPPVCTYQGMDSLLNLRYQMMADSNEALLSPVGAVWKYIRLNSPSIGLYQADESHPSLAGTYAAACSFYSAIFRNDPNQIISNAGLDSATARIIRMAAKRVVFDSLLSWNIGSFDLKARMSIANIGGFNYAFIDSSINANARIWSFLGKTDTAQNLSVSFPGRGTYPIELRVFNECDSIIIQDTIRITSSHLVGLNTTDFQVYPNPASESILLTGPGQMKNISLFDVYGKMVFFRRQVEPGTKLDVSRIAAGNYLLKVEYKNTMLYRRVLLIK